MRKDFDLQIWSSERINLMERVKEHIEEISRLLGIKPTAGNAETPKRIAKMLTGDVFESVNLPIGYLEQQMTLFPCEGKPVDVCVKDIPFSSMCEHHWLPFMGTVTVCYTPDKQIIGLSKIPRVVKFFSRKPQVQERLTKEIGDFLFETIKPLRISVEVEALHTCVTCRGVRSDSKTETYYERSKEG